MRSWLVTPASLLAAGMLAACISHGSDTKPEPERHQRFIGSWIVEQPYHALYEATIYTFSDAGVIERGATYTVDEIGDDYVTGSVADPQSGVSCLFANRWYSTDEVTLVIDGNCSDGRYREIVLGFGEPGSNSVDAEVVVLSVGGEDGWVHDDWSWRWRRCDDAGCALP